MDKENKAIEGDISEFENKILDADDRIRELEDE